MDSDSFVEIIQNYADTTVGQENRVPSHLKMTKF